jgi:hypothetical protein
LLTTGDWDFSFDVAFVCTDKWTLSVVTTTTGRLGSG